MEIIKFLIELITFLTSEYIFFILAAKWYGKKCNYNCKECKNWACTHEGPYENKPCYPVKDWSKWCKGEKNGETKRKDV